MRVLPCVAVWPRRVWPRAGLSAYTRCWFLAVDFDKKSWMQDVAAFRDTTRAKGVPVAIERSRSGNGAHAWIFFAEPVPAPAARRLGALLVTATSGNGVRGTESSQTRRWRGESAANSSRKSNSRAAPQMGRFHGDWERYLVPWSGFSGPEREITGQKPSISAIFGC